MSYFIQHKEEFEQWAKTHKVESTTDRTWLKVGDKVTYTNTFGVVFEGHEILGFAPEDFYGRFIYLDLDCFWMPQQESSLTLYKSAECSEVLQLMDTYPDANYCKALREVLAKYPDTDREKLEKELDKFI